MKVFQQKIRLSALAKRELALGYSYLARSGPDNSNIGICYHISKHSPRDGYEVTRALFRSITGKRRDSYPLHSPTACNWAIRQKWCAAFAKSFETGTIVVDEEMEALLSTPIDPRRQIV